MSTCIEQSPSHSLLVTTKYKFDCIYMQSLHLYAKLKWNFFVRSDSMTEKHQNINKYAKRCKITIGSVCRMVYHKNPQIRHTFSPKIITRNYGCGLSAGTFEKSAANVDAYVRFHVQSNAWLLGLECSAHFLVVMQKSMEKLCWMKKFLSTNTRKRLSPMSKLVETMFIILKW